MIKISNLKKSFHSTEILKSISFSVKEGETVAIIGPSGSGKSTLLRCLNLLENPDEGHVSIDNLQYSAPHIKKKEVVTFRKNSAMVFQDFCLFENKTVLENIVMPLTVVKKKEREEAVLNAKRLLKQVGVLDKINVYPSQLSGGQKQRVAIARAIALNPKVLLFDEPTSALDPELVSEVLDVIRGVSKLKMTSIIVTHEIDFAKEVADYVIFIDKGEIVEMGKPKEVIENPKHTRTKKFLAYYNKS